MKTNYHRPYFIITIDTEGDNIWENSTNSVITTENSKFLSRFQALAEKHDLKPTYLTNYEMAMSKDFQNFGKLILKEKSGEIGMHLHAWDSPPNFDLTSNDNLYNPYLIEYPNEVMYEKILFMTKLLEDIFEIKMTSHRAGRWAFNETYAKMIFDLDYLVDCSVTPNLSWENNLGDPKQSGGSCYYEHPEIPYFLNMNDISKSGSSSSLLEVPLSVLYLDSILDSFTRSRALEKFKKNFPEKSLFYRFINKITPKPIQLRPNGSNINEMLKLLDEAVKRKWPCVEFMLHSSEFMPGGSPRFQTNQSIENLYTDLEILFDYAKDYFLGGTLTEFHKVYSNNNI